MMVMPCVPALQSLNVALRCRDFSIFDFRVDPEGEVYMLECQPVCSFARESAMMGMASKTDDPALQYPTLYHTMLRRAVARKPKPYDGSQKCVHQGRRSRQVLPRVYLDFVFGPPEHGPFRSGDGERACRRAAGCHA